MGLLARLLAFLRRDDDALVEYRDRIARLLCTLSSVLLLPFTINHVVHGRWALAAAVATAQAVMVINAWSLHRGRSPFLPYWVMGSTMVAALMTSVYLQGLHGTFWAYPTLFICYFVLPRRAALVLSMVLLAGVGTLAYEKLGVAVAARVIATLSLTWVMINVVLNMVCELQQAMTSLAITDPLTGAFNRRHLQNHLVRLDAQGQVDIGQPLRNALLTVDIDHFKAINDRHGHGVGDAVLRKTVALVSARTRKSDLLFRTGGEEFVLLLPGATMEEAMLLAEDLRRIVEQAELVPGERITVSVGVSMQRAGQSGDDWMRGSDNALYVAKRNGRNRVAFAA